MSEPYSLTRQLLSSSTSDTNYKLATENPFLLKAQQANDLLSFWLYQDRIYAAHAYPKFIGSLIANIPFSDESSSPEVVEPESKETVTLSQGILETLVFCLTNVMNEVQFFQETSKKWGLNVDGWKERKGTRDYTAEMARISANGKIEDGLVFLWAMEKVYLDAWTYARNTLKDDASASSDNSASASAFAAFAHNWSTPEFETFVEDLAKLVDSVVLVKGGDSDSQAYKRAKAIWDRVVELEIGFWPEAEELKEHSVDGKK